MKDVFKEISDIGIIPVLNLQDPSVSELLANALCDEDIPCGELTYRTEKDDEALRRILSGKPDMIIGVGHILTCDQIDKAAASGAKFVATAGINPKLINHCKEKGIPILPGVRTPSDIEVALELDINTVRLYPLEVTTGMSLLRMMSGSYPMMRFAPVLGRTDELLPEIATMSSVLAACGSWMINQDLLAKGDYAGIAALCRQSINTILGLSLAHVGIHCKNESEAETSSAAMCSLLHLPAASFESKVFSGTLVEFMKGPWVGEKGHIGILTNSIDRAVAYMQKKGFNFNFETMQKNAEGKTNVIYLNEEIAGFGIHLMQR
jgi:2-dehydro-3-deoxyphosphogluconate aldolase/(4S)-4-hydroxy-2-oxoglutarate aldolase